MSTYQQREVSIYVYQIVSYRPFHILSHYLVRLVFAGHAWRFISMITKDALLMFLIFIGLGFVESFADFIYYLFH